MADSLRLTPRITLRDGQMVEFDYHPDKHAASLAQLSVCTVGVETLLLALLSLVDDQLLVTHADVFTVCENYPPSNPHVVIVELLSSDRWSYVPGCGEKSLRCHWLSATPVAS